MPSQHKFTLKTKMSELINEDVSLLSCISRFGVSLGFRDNTVEETCIANQIDTNTFLAVVNFLSEGNVELNETYNKISIASLINYLQNAHTYFLEYKLPSIRTKLIDAVATTDQNIPYKVVFLKYFDGYVLEVKKHMEYENKIVFPYVLNLINGNQNQKYNISIFEDQHAEVETKLIELKNILVKYYPAKGTNYMLNDVLFDLLWCEKDLASHNQVEDFFFVPVIDAIEKQQNSKK